jgi:isoamylase
MFAGRNEADTADEMAFIAVNAHWEHQEMTLPELPPEWEWRVAVNTGGQVDNEIILEADQMPPAGSGIELEARSVMILMAVEQMNG